MIAAHSAVSTLRPSGAGYVRYEDIYVNGDTLQQTLNRVTGNKIVTFPLGTFSFSDFVNGYYNGIRIGSGGATACGGIVGSGRGTVFQMTPNSSTQQAVGNATSGTNPCVLIDVEGTSGSPLVSPVMKNFTLLGTTQGHYYNGLRFAYCNDAVADGLYLLGAAPGYANYPPGETFSFSTFHSPRCILKNTEIDCRNAAGTRICTSPIGWNNTTDAYVYNTYAHHALAGMPTFYSVTNVTTYNLWSEYNGSGTGSLDGCGINHENVSGAIRHYYPILYPNYSSTGGNNGLHIAFNNGSAGNNSNIQIIEPTFDPGPTGGCFSVEIDDNYTDPGGVAQTQTSMPTIIKNGSAMTARDTNNGVSNPNPATQFFRYH